jgi:K+-transporting ATPase KdpF subunit
MIYPAKKVRGCDHARYHICGSRGAAVWVDGGLRACLQQAVRFVMIEPIAGLVVAIGLGLYLLYCLLHPEKF